MEYKINYNYTLDDFNKYQEFTVQKYRQKNGNWFFYFVLPLFPIAIILFSLILFNSQPIYYIMGIISIIVFFIWYCKLFFGQKKQTISLYKRIFNDETGCRQHITISDTGLTIEDDVSTISNNWNGISEILEYQNYLIICFRHGNGIPIPLKDIEYDIKEIIEFVNKNIKQNVTA